jgi:outer membrane receptor protein involved in Fe transport
MTLLRPASLLLALALATPAAAEDTAPPAPSATPDPAEAAAAARYAEKVEVMGELPVIPPFDETATKLPVPALKTPLSVTVIPRNLFESQVAVVMADALRNAASANAQPGFGVFDFFTLRGFDSLSTGLVLTDGAPEPESAFYPLYNVRQVEVLRGPAAFLYGGNPLSGAIHLLRKQPKEGRFADVSIGGGSFGHREGRLDANTSSADGRWALRLNALWNESDGYRDDKASKMAAFNPVVTFKPSSSLTVTGSAEYVRSEQSPDAGVPVVQGAAVDVPTETSYDALSSFSEQDTWRLRLDVLKTFSESLRLRNKTYSTRLKWDSEGTLHSGVAPDGRGSLFAFRTQTFLDDHQRLTGNQTELIWSVKTGAVQHQWLFGVEVSRLRDDFSQDVAMLSPLDAFAPVVPAQEFGLPLPAFGQRGDSTSDVLAGYALDRMQVTDKLELTVGARLDRVSFEDRPTGSDRQSTEVSPMGGIVFLPTKDVALYASAGRGFAPPSIQVVGPREPETSRQVEAGVKVQFLQGKAFATAAVYQLERDNMPIPDAFGLTRQQGDQRSRGFELELAAEHEGFFATAAYAYTDAELTRFAELGIVGFDPATFQPAYGVLDRSGNVPAFAPRHLGNLYAMRRFANGFGVALGARLVGSQFIAEDNATKLDSYVLLDAALSYQKRQWRAVVSLQNLTDEEYGTRGFSTYAVIPGKPFSVQARLELNLGR